MMILKYLFVDSIVSSSNNLGWSSSTGNWLLLFWFSCWRNTKSEPPFSFFNVLACLAQITPQNCDLWPLIWVANWSCPQRPLESSDSYFCDCDLDIGVPLAPKNWRCSVWCWVRTTSDFSQTVCSLYLHDAVIGIEDFGIKRWPSSRSPSSEFAALPMTFWRLLRRIEATSSCRQSFDVPSNWVWIDIFLVALFPARPFVSTWLGPSSSDPAQFEWSSSPDQRLPSSIGFFSSNSSSFWGSDPACHPRTVRFSEKYKGKRTPRLLAPSFLLSRYLVPRSFHFPTTTTTQPSSVFLFSLFLPLSNTLSFFSTLFLPHSTSSSSLLHLAIDSWSWPFVLTFLLPCCNPLPLTLFTSLHRHSLPHVYHPIMSAYPHLAAPPPSEASDDVGILTGGLKMNWKWTLVSYDFITWSAATVAETLWIHILHIVSFIICICTVQAPPLF